MELLDYVVVVQLLSHVQISATLWTAAFQSSLSYYLPEFPQIHVRWVGDAIKPSYPLPLSSPFAFNISQHQGLLHWVGHWGGQSIGASASAAVLPMNIQGWFPLGLTGLISCSARDSRIFSRTTVQKHQFSSPQPFYSPTLTSIHDYWKSHSCYYTDLYWQSDISAF